MNKQKSSFNSLVGYGTFYSEVDKKEFKTKYVFSSGSIVNNNDEENNIVSLKLNGEQIDGNNVLYTVHVMTENTYLNCIGTPMYGLGHDNSVSHILIDTNAEDENGITQGTIYIIAAMDGNEVKVIIQSYERLEAIKTAKILSDIFYIPVLEDDGENKNWLYDPTTQTTN